MLGYQWVNGGEGLVLRVHLQDSSTGQGKTNLTTSTSGLKISAILDNESSGKTFVASTSIESCTPGSYSAPSTTSKCRFAEVDQSNHPGLYEIQLADERWSDSAARYLSLSVSGVSGLRDFSTLIQLNSVPADLRRIEGHELDAADLTLQSLTVSNPNGTAVTFESTDADGAGLRIQGIGDSCGMSISGGEEGESNSGLEIRGNGINPGLSLFGGGDGGIAVGVLPGTDAAGIIVGGGKSDGSMGAVTVLSSNAPAVCLGMFGGNPENTHPIASISGVGAGAAVVIKAGETGTGLELQGGATSGNAVRIGTSDGDGVVVDSAGSGKVDVNATLPDSTGVGTVITRLGIPEATIAGDVAGVKSDTTLILDDTGTSGVVVAAGSKNGYALSSAYDLYHADIQFTRDEVHEQDEYTVTWFKNGVRLTGVIEDPMIQVVKREDGLDLVESIAMSPIGTTGSYKHDEDEVGNRIVNGEAAIVIVTAYLDDATRSFARVVGRDAS